MMLLVRCSSFRFAAEKRSWVDLLTAELGVASGKVDRQDVAPRKSGQAAWRHRWR